MDLWQHMLTKKSRAMSNELHGNKISDADDARYVL